VNHNTIDKSTLLTWLLYAPEKISVEELQQFIEAKTNTSPQDADPKA
jgi:hypothetical protein